MKQFDKKQISLESIQKEKKRKESEFFEKIIILFIAFFCFTAIIFFFSGSNEFESNQKNVNNREFDKNNIKVSPKSTKNKGL